MIQIKDILSKYKTIAMIGVSNDLTKPSTIVMKYMQKYGYKVFIMVDDNSTKYPSKINGVNILQIDDKKCISLGYKNASRTLKKNPVTWDKVFYYFSNVDTKFEHIWFIEEDVFIPRFNLILELDKQNPTEDLLCKQDIPEITDTEKWHWKIGKGKISKPWYRSLLCCHRQSNRLLQRIKDYCEEKNSLLFLEMMVNTLAHQNNYKVKPLPNLQTITWRQKFKIDDILQDNLYHPMKNLKQQKEYRKRL